MKTLFLAERLNNFYVAVGDTFDHDSFDPQSYTTCVHVPGALGEAETRTIPCDRPVKGRYVTVYFNANQYLTICELEVYSLAAPGKFKAELLRFKQVIFDCGQRGAYKFGCKISSICELISVKCRTNLIWKMTAIYPLVK